MNPGFVVTGTDTDVGKTVAAAGLVAALGATYWKPVQAGLADATDSETIARLAAIGPDRILPEGYRLRTPCSPHEAARIDEVRIDRSRLSRPTTDRPLIIEGAGGIMVPINGSELMLDLFADWALPVILVARTKLGTINHSLLSIHMLRSRSLRIAGILFMGDENRHSEDSITSFGDIAHLGRVPWLDPLGPDALASAMADQVRLDLLR